MVVMVVSPRFFSVLFKKFNFNYSKKVLKEKLLKSLKINKKR